MDQHTERLLKDICQFAKMYYEDSFESCVHGEDHEEEMCNRYSKEVMGIVRNQIGSFKERKRQTPEEFLNQLDE